MKRNTKLEIIKVAKELFNERGYNDVSTQDISDALGISKGNLNYHFKRKEDIIEAIVEEMHSHYVKPKTPTSLEELNTHFINAEKIIKENAFYFWHYTQLGQLSKEIKKIQNTVIQDNYHVLDKAFKLLIEEGSLQKEEYLGQYEQTIPVIMLTYIYWTPLERLEESTGSSRDFLDSIWAIIYPLLTEKGKKQYKVLKRKF